MDKARMIIHWIGNTNFAKVPKLEIVHYQMEAHHSFHH